MGFQLIPQYIAWGANNL